MATYTETWRNSVWLVWSFLQLPLILLIDGLEFYPSWVYEPRGSPLHIFYAAKQQYIAELNDPIAQWSQATASGHDSWMGLWIYLEWVVALPILLFTVYRLGVQRRGTSGAHELALLVYAFHTVLTTLTCVHDVFYWDNAVYTAAVKNKILYQAYSPWLIIPSILFIDMAGRILGRINAADAALAEKKTLKMM